MSEEQNPTIAVFVIAVVGGLIAGSVCSVAIIYTLNTVYHDLIMQSSNLSVVCTDERSPFASVVTIGAKTYYCTLEEKKGVDDFRIT